SLFTTVKIEGFRACLKKSCFGGAGRDRTADKGFADLCLTTWRPRLGSFHILSDDSQPRLCRGKSAAKKIERGDVPPLSKLPDRVRLADQLERELQSQLDVAGGSRA